MEIIHLSAECYPVVKVGGLGDVVGALPKYQCKAGHVAKVVIPAYNTKFMQQNEWSNEHEFDIDFGGQRLHYQVLKEKTNKLGFDLYCILIDGLTNREAVYSEPDDTERFLAFQIAALDWMSQWKHQPNVIHCHDHHTALVPFMLQNCYRFHRLYKVKTIFTIHNGVYQGWFPWKKVAYMPAFNQFNAGALDWNGIVNPMACAVRCANAVTTVSWSYMYELMEKANGLEALFQSLRHKCHGVLNGIDNDIWNPADDAYLAHHFTAENVFEGKKKHKQEICAMFQLNPDNPLIVFIGRLVGEKGADLLPNAIGRALYETKGQVNYLVLGSGDTNVEGGLNHLKSLCPGIYNCFIGYNEALSHRLYAAADFIVMPSRVEPCGLNQMYALRYGTIPMVRNTGGLRDTVVDFGDWEGYGIRFNNASVDDVVLSTHRALNLYRDTARFQHIQQRIMGFDNSWERSTAQYEKIYG